MPKVFVFSEEDPSLQHGQIDCHNVFCAWSSLGDHKHIMPGSAEGANHGKVTILIGEKTHPSPLCTTPWSLQHDRFLVWYSVSGIANGSLDIL